MVRKLYGVALGSLFLLSACGSSDDSQGSSGKFSEGFDKGWTTEFVKGCTSEAIKTGMPADESSKVCECMAKHLNKSLDNVAEKINPPEAKANAALEACMPKP